MKLAQSFFGSFVFLLLGLNGAYAADQRPVVTDPALNMDSQPHWHLGDPGREIGPEKALLYVKRVGDVDQIFMTDMTDPAHPQELQLTDSPGNKSDPVWGPKLAKIRVPSSAKFFNPFLNLNVPLGSTIRDEIFAKMDEIRATYNDPRNVKTYTDTWVIFYSASVVADKSVIMMKPVGRLLDKGSVQSYLMDIKVEIPLTQVKPALFKDQSYFKDSRPVVSFYRNHENDPFMAEFHALQRRVVSEKFQIAYIRQNDPNSGSVAVGSSPNMLYKLDIYPEFIDLDKFLRFVLYKNDAAGLKASYLKNNLTYAYSGNCVGGQNPLGDADHPEWFPDGQNLVFEFNQRIDGPLAKKQIATVHNREPNRACVNSSLVIHTHSDASHAFPRVSPVALFQGHVNFQYGILFDATDPAGHSSLGALVVELNMNLQFCNYNDLFSASPEMPLLFNGPVGVNRQHPVWARAPYLPAGKVVPVSEDVIQQNAYIAFEREEGGHYQIYGSEITFGKIPIVRDACGMGMIKPHRLFFAHLGIPSAFAGVANMPVPAAVFDEVPFTRCGGDHTWPEFTGNSTLNADGDFPFDASYLLADDSKHVMHLFDLPAPTDDTCSVVVPTCAEQHQGSPDTDADGVVDACDACPNDPLANAAGATCTNVCDVTPGSAGDGDSDGKADFCDNCSKAANADQADRDANGTGDVCDLVPDPNLCLEMGGQVQLLPADQMISCALGACPLTNANGEPYVIERNERTGMITIKGACSSLKLGVKSVGGGCSLRIP